MCHVRPVIPSFTKRPKKPEEIGGGNGARGRGGGSGRGRGSGRGGGSGGGGGPGRPRGRSGRGRARQVQPPTKVLTPGSYLAQVCKYLCFCIFLLTIPGNLFGLTPHRTLHTHKIIVFVLGTSGSGNYL
jgi:hypothetical protein